jgi:hypothetical protein
MHIRRSGTAAAIALLVAGCHLARYATPSDLQRLDGWSPEHADLAVIDTQGERFILHPEDRLYLQLSGNTFVGGRFTSISIRDQLFIGQRADGPPIVVPLEIVDFGKVTYYGRNKTTAGTVVAAVLGGIVTILFLAFVATYHSG